MSQCDVLLSPVVEPLRECGVGGEAGEATEGS